MRINRSYNFIILLLKFVMYIIQSLSVSLSSQPSPPVQQAKSRFKRRSTANNIEIRILVPTDTDSLKFKTTVGRVKWDPREQ